MYLLLLSCGREGFSLLERPRVIIYFEETNYWKFSCFGDYSSCSLLYWLFLRDSFVWRYIGIFKPNNKIHVSPLPGVFSTTTARSPSFQTRLPRFKIIFHEIKRGASGNSWIFAYRANRGFATTSFADYVALGIVSSTWSSADYSRMLLLVPRCLPIFARLTGTLDLLNNFWREFTRLPWMS